MIGGRKRSFSQIKKDIDEAVKSVEEGGSRFKAGMSAFFSAPKKPLVELDKNSFKSYFNEFNKQANKGKKNIDQFIESCSDKGFTQWIKQVDQGSRTQANYSEYIKKSNASLNKMTLSSKAAAVGMKALSMATNMLATMVMSWVVFEGLPMLFDALITTQKDAIKTANELSEAYKKLDDEAITVQEQIGEIGSKIAKLNDLGKLSLTQEGELERLKEENIELENRFIILEKERNLKKSEANTAAITASKKVTNDIDWDLVNPFNKDTWKSAGYDLLTIIKNPSSLFKLDETNDTNSAELFAMEIQKYTSAMEKSKNYKQKEKNRLKKEEYELKLLDEVKTRETLLGQITGDDAESNEARRRLMLEIDFYSSYIFTATEKAQKNFSEVFNDVEFTDTNKALSELSKQGNLTADSFSDPKFKPFVDELIRLNVISSNTPESLQSIIAEINSLNPAVVRTVSAIEVLAEDLKKAREETDKFVTSAKTLSSAFAEQKENGQLSSESILSITDAGYASALQVDAETGAVTLNADAYIQLAKAKMEEHLITLLTNRNTIKQQLDNEKEAVNQLTTAYNSSRDAMLLAKLAEHKATRDGLQGQYDNADAEVESILAVIKNLNNITSGTYGMSEEEIAKKRKELAEKQAESQKKLDELATQNRLDLLKHELEEKKALIEKYNSDIELLDLEAELNNGLSNEKTMENLSTKFDTMVEKGKALKTEFEYLSDLQPTTAAEAQAIADRITQVGADIRANLIDLNKIRQEIDMFRVDVINQQVTSRSEMASREFELLDKNMKLIQDHMSGKESLFGNNLMPFDFLLPTVSKTALEKKEEETEKLIDEEQRRQDEINRIVKEAADKQLAENQKMRSEEAAKIIADMQSTQNELKKIIEHPDIDTSKYRELGKEAGKEFSDGFNENAKVAKDDSKPSRVHGGYGKKVQDGDKSVEKLFGVIKDNDKNARITQGVGVGSHNGEFGWQNAIDVAGIETAEAVAEGKVVFAGWKAGNSYGRHVVIHDDQNAYIYAHLASINDNIKVGETVGRGTELGVVGGSSAASGKLVDNVYGKHLHLQQAPLQTRAGGGTTTQDEVLVGEEGKELAVLPNGRKVMLGANGAELVNLPIGTHIYNNDDTNEIIKYTGSDVENSTVTKYAKGTDSKKPPKMKEDEKKKLLDELEGMNLDPQTLYSKEFSEAYLKNQKDRQKSVKEIEALDKKIASGKNVESNTTKRNQMQTELDLSDAQATSDLMKTSAEANFAYYEDLRSKTLKEYDDYIKKVDDGTVAFDAEVNATYIDSIGALNEELVKSNEEFQKSQEILNQITDTALGDLDKYLDGITHDLQKQSEEYDSQISKQQASLDATKSHYNYTRQLKEESIEYAKQLRVTQALSGLLSAEEIKFHFNMGDFEKFNSVITGIQGDIDLSTTKYKSEIASLGEDELYKAEKITAEYNAQMEAEMKKLNIAKAEYSVSKAKQELEKVKKQRDTLMFTGDKWEYVADFEKVADATENLVQAEEDLKLSEFDKESQQIIDTEASGLYATQQQKAALDNQINIVNKAAEDLKYEYNKYLNPVKDLGGIIDVLGTVDFPKFQSALTKFKDTLNSFSIGGSTSGNGGSTSGGDSGGGAGNGGAGIKVGDKIKVLKGGYYYKPDRNYQNWSSIDSTSEWVGEDITIDKVKTYAGQTYVFDNKRSIWLKLSEVQKYAKGTQNAKAGLAQFDEEGNGTEALFKQTSSGNFTMMKQGDHAFSKADMNNLWRLVKDPESNILSNLISKQFQPKIDIPNIQPISQQANQTFNFGDLSFPNIKGIDDAELFTKQLGGLVNKAIQKAYSSR